MGVPRSRYVSSPGRLGFGGSRTWLLGAVLLALGACLRPPDYPLEPVVTFLGVSRDTMRQGSNLEDSVTVVLEFTDGDGDVTSLTGDTVAGVFLVNTRTGETVSTFRLDEIDQTGIENGIRGELRLRVYTTCCDYPPEIPEFPCNPSAQFPLDVLNLEAYLVDQAGNESNRAQVTPIYLRCDTF